MLLVSTELEERGFSQWSGHPGPYPHLYGCSETHGYRRSCAGSIFSAIQANTQLQRTAAIPMPKNPTFAANRDDCNGMGKREAILGYDLKQ